MKLVYKMGRAAREIAALLVPVAAAMFAVGMKLVYKMGRAAREIAALLVVVPVAATMFVVGGVYELLAPVARAVKVWAKNV